MSKFTLSALTALAFAFVASVRPALADGPVSGSIVIAIANVDKIQQSIHESNDIIQELKTEQDVLKNQQNDKIQNLNALKQALSYLKPDSDQYRSEADKFDAAQIDYKNWAEVTQASLDRKSKTVMRQLYLEIEDAIAQVATKDGINLVVADVRTPIPDNVDSITTDQLRMLLVQRTVLYSDGAHDISAEVITLMDKNYAAKVTPH